MIRLRILRLFQTCVPNIFRTDQHACPDPSFRVPCLVSTTVEGTQHVVTTTDSLAPYLHMVRKQWQSHGTRSAKYLTLSCRYAWRPACNIAILEAYLKTLQPLYVLYINIKNKAIY